MSAFGRLDALLAGRDDLMRREKNKPMLRNSRLECQMLKATACLAKNAL